MKLSPRAKKILTVLAVVVIAVALSGCSVPRDDDGNVILIETTTKFTSIMSDESWFSALFVWPLSQLINFMTPHIGVGGAIAVITIVINGILAFGTFKSTIATQEMQMIQPELQRIQRKYEGRDDAVSKNKMAQETQNLYAKHNINPFSTILVTFIQLPIIMAMYMSVQRSAAVQNGTFLGLNLQTTPLEGIQDQQWLYLVLFAVMGVVQFISTSLPQYFAKKSAEREAEKHHKRPEDTSNKSSKIMQIYMLGMILVFGLMWPTAMTLYWTINSGVNIVKTVVVQTYIQKRNEKEGKRR